MGRRILPNPEVRLMWREQRMRSSLFREFEKRKTLERSLQTLAKLCIRKFAPSSQFPIEAIDLLLLLPKRSVFHSQGLFQFIKTPT